MKQNPSNKRKPYYIGIDLGGTSIHSGLVYADGKIGRYSVIHPTEARKSRKTVLDNIVRTVQELQDKNGVAPKLMQGIGIGSPGPLDLAKGRILDPVNIPTLNYFNIRNYFAKLFSVKVELNNDANCFALAEAWFGVGRKARVTVGVTLGTGLGCGIVFGKELYNGCTGTAAEVWNTPYRDSTFEDCISIRSVLRYAGNPENLTPLDIANGARQGNKRFRQAWEEFGKHLGIFIATAVNFFDPDVIALGGSMSGAFDLFEKTMWEFINPNINEFPRKNIRIQPSRLGTVSGILGAAALVTPRLKKV